MESSIFFQTRKGNQYLYDRNKAYLVSVPPIMEQIYLTDTASNTDNESLLKRVMKKNLTLPPNEVEYEVKRYLFFKSNGFFSNFNSKELISARLTPQVVEQQLTSLHSILFQVTNKCNLRCKYCCYGEFYENTSPLKNLDIEIVNKLFNYMLPYWISKKTLTHQPTIRIGFYGGEPLFNFHLVQQIVEICERIKCCYSVNFQYTMTTNAVLLDKYMDYLVGHNFTLLLSLDGNRVHNYLRVDAQGKESFDKVYQNIKKLQQLHSDYFDKNVDFNSVLNNKSSTDEVQSFILSEFGKQPTISSISFTGVKRERIEEVKEIYKDYKESIDTLTKRGSKSPYWGGLIGTATVEKSGLMSSDDKKFGLNRYLVTNRTFMKIMVGKNWERYGSLIYGNVNGFPYLVIISMYCSLNAPVYSVRWVIGETTKLKFYYKGFEVYVLFGYYENEPHYAFVQSSSGIEIISRGEDVGQGYTEITT